MEIREFSEGLHRDLILFLKEKGIKGKPGTTLPISVLDERPDLKLRMSIEYRTAYKPLERKLEQVLGLREAEKSVSTFVPGEELPEKVKKKKAADLSEALNKA